MLLEQSRPRPQMLWLWYLLASAVVVGLVGWAGQGGSGSDLVWLGTTLLMLALIGGMLVISYITVQAQRTEQRQIAAIEEFVQLRRWQQAGALLQQVLSRPRRNPAARAQALIYLAAVLARYHRFEDAMAVQDYLLHNVPVDPGTARGLRLGRAMAMLHEDHLVDADRAIGELRRESGRGESGGLALIELYRDVKTGHAAEAVEVFQAHLEVMRRQLGQRIADAYGLLARAYDMLGQSADAQLAYEKATLLVPPTELSRRYAEIASLAGKYTPAAAPADWNAAAGDPIGVMPPVGSAGPGSATGAPTP